MQQNSSLNIGIIGWRGLVGQVLIERFNQTKILSNETVYLFSTQVCDDITPPFIGTKAIQFGLSNDQSALAQCDILISCQGSEYTQRTLSNLRENGWSGYWLDAASHLRLNPEATLILDPINGATIKNAIINQQKTFVGPNCCTSLLLLALQGLYEQDIVKHVDTHTYQAISGAGTQQLKNYLTEVSTASKHIDINDLINSCCQLENPDNKSTLLNNVIPWIDVLCDEGVTKEELKFEQEATKLLATQTPISATCVRVNTLRCHSQSVTITLDNHYTLAQLKDWLSQGNDWVKLIEDTNPCELSPKYIANTLNIAVGRIRQDKHRSNVIHLFTIGDQLLWGAAEPLVRTCQMILKYQRQALGAKTDQVDWVK
ncbi:MAG: aspartate-semialdehyde dehydrogenase [Pseudomonadota bacterium]|nr:aspartate-semialdehyde dehydrogenase [Pseudomonadota bacterium]